MAATTLPSIPVPHGDLVNFIAEHPKDSLVNIIEPYRRYEATLRQVYAQEPDREILKDPHVNVLPVFTNGAADVKIRARNPWSESQEERAKYIMPLSADVRRPDGSAAVVPTFKEFQRNFNVFSESSLVELDWSNVVAAGSSVVNTLLPIPDKYNVSKKTMREFYHEKFCPASDVDLFLYDMTEEEAIEKIKDIEAKVRDSLLTETTVVRTKNAVTICSQYPTRHIQIVLRIYKSVSEILTGFDIDSSCAAYDGKQVYCTPRALQSFITQINHIDLSRRSPSYENRLSKYSHRGFEVYWNDLDRSRIDPTIFERSFQRTMGLARLLVLERLPTSSARDVYLDKRREERGRPKINRYYRNLHSLAGNIKEHHEDEVAEWVDEDEVSNYHTFTVPYGVKFHAKKIEKLCYTRDLLLNAEWNQADDRDVYLHRHPAFFGRFEDVVNDCCGYCPTPETDEEKEVAETEAKIYVSGRISFIKDDPGRQSIGSFNPLTENDWTEMAYVGNTARLCQAIVDADEEHVEDWLAQDGADPNTRDYTGRTPLHLAAISSTPAIVQRLVDAGARLVARLADGRTALHLAAERGNVDIVKILMDQSLANEAEEDEKQEAIRKAKANPGVQSSKDAETDSSESESDGELIEDDDSDEYEHSMATGSFVKLQKSLNPSDSADILPDEPEDDPDFYDVNVVAWDTPCSAMHYAIVSGHESVVKLLCQEYGADVLLPVKFLDNKREPQAALLSLVLAASLPAEQAQSMIKVLLELGATSAQAEMSGMTAFHRFVQQGKEPLVDTVWELDATGAKTALNHISMRQNQSPETPLLAAIRNSYPHLAERLIDRGAQVEIKFEAWLKMAKQCIENQLHGFEANKHLYESSFDQPLICAIQSSRSTVALSLIKGGADVNTLSASTHQMLQHSWYHNPGESALDMVCFQLEKLREYKGEKAKLSKPELQKGFDNHLAKFEVGTYQHFMVLSDVQGRRKKHCNMERSYQRDLAALASKEGIREKEQKIREATKLLETIEKALIERGGKKFKELYPEKAKEIEKHQSRYNSGNNNPAKLEAYEYNFTFQGVNDVTDARKKAYLELFEAAWVGNLEKIKHLTLTSWDAEGVEPPLKIMVKDGSQNTPFSVAFLRGHHQVARAILEIVQAQYSPLEQKKTRYRMAKPEEDDSEYCSDEESDAESTDDSRPRLYGEIVDQRFTIDDVGQVSMKVKSHTKPLELLRMPCNEISDGGQTTNAQETLFKMAIKKNDLKNLKLLLDMAEYALKLSAAPEDTEDNDTAHFFSFPDHEFQHAVEEGRTELLAEIISRTGAGLPLEDLVKHTGVVLTEKPRHYQGLTVYGKKRKDWATAGRLTSYRRDTGSQVSPLITAALAGSIESVEWFLSDAPLRHYLAFASSHGARDDARLRHLRNAPGGIDRAVSRWLDEASDLVLHAAILAPPRQKTLDLVAYLARSGPPGALEAKSLNWQTPLSIALALRRKDIVKILIEAGAAQAYLAPSRTTLLHVALTSNPTAAQLTELLAPFDADIVAAMCAERTSLGGGGRTPLHAWLCDALGIASRYGEKPPKEKLEEEIVEVINLLLRLAGDRAGELLERLDATGDTPLHTAVAKEAAPVVLRALLDAGAPLHRESAVGRTPLEVARDRFVAARITAPVPASRHYNNYYWNRRAGGVSDLIDKKPEDFAHGANPKEERTAVEKVWDVCREYAEREDGGRGQRRLVALHEANDVAKRLGEMHTGERCAWQIGRPGEKRPADDGGIITLDPQSAGKRIQNVFQNMRTTPYHGWKVDDEVDGEKPELIVCDFCGDQHEPVINPGAENAE